MMKSHVLAMRFFLLGTLLLPYPGTLVEAGEKYILIDADPWEVSLSSFSFESVNIQPLLDRATERFPAVAQAELAPRVKMNMRYIFHNRLNRARFLVAPSPETFIEQISTILNLSAELHQLTGDGRELLVRESEPERYSGLVRKIGETARELKSSFEEFFLEGGNSRYVLEYPKVESLSAKFTHFILQSEKINKELSARLDEFFFGSAPGAIALADYKRSSVLVLSESLSKLCRIAEKEIADSGQVR